MKFTRVLSASVLAGAVLLSSTACGFLPQDEKKVPSPTGTMTTMPNPGDAVSTEAASTPSATSSSTAPSSGFANVMDEPSMETSTDDSGVESSESIDDSSESLKLDMSTDPEAGDYIPDMTSDLSNEPSDASAAVEEKYVAEEPVGVDYDAENAAQAVRVAATLNDFYAYVLNPATYDQLVSAGKQFVGRDEIPESEVLKFAQDNPSIFRHFDTSTAENVRNAYANLLVSSYIGKNVPGIMITIPVETVTVAGDYANVDASRAVITRNGVDYSNSTDAGTFIELSKLSNGAWVTVASPLN